MSLDCSGVYQIRCSGNCRSYIGSSKNIQARWSHHLYLLTGGYHYNRKLQASFSKYGASSFSIEVMLVCPAEELLAREQEYLDRLSPELNCSMKASCPESTEEVRMERAKRARAQHENGSLGRSSWKSDPRDVQKKIVETRRLNGSYKAPTFEWTSERRERVSAAMKARRAREKESCRT